MRPCPSRCVVSLLTPFHDEPERVQDQVASLIEIHYAMRGVNSNTLPRITEGEIVTSPMASSEELSSSLNGSTLDCSLSSFEHIKRSGDSVESTISSFSIIDVDQDDLDESQPPEVPQLTEEEEFLASIDGEMDEFGVRHRCTMSFHTLPFKQAQFRRYHQSDVLIRKANRKAVGWFSGTSEAQSGGQKMTIKRYDGEKDLALKVRDRVFIGLLLVYNLSTLWASNG
jgi:hypothetical protein